jgi:hypothetical protein
MKVPPKTGIFLRRCQFFCLDWIPWGWRHLLDVFKDLSVTKQRDGLFLKDDIYCLRDCAPFGHPGQIPQSGMRAGIQNDLMFRKSPGFPFDFAQGGEPVEPRVSPDPVSSTRQSCGARPE